MQSLYVTVSVLLLVAMSAPGFGEVTVVDRPAVKPGDSWQFIRIDHMTGVPIGLGREVITFVNDRVIQTVVTGRDAQGQLREREGVYTPDWSLISSHDGFVFEPDNALLRFPVTVGASYGVSFEMRAPKLGPFRLRNERKVKVVGWEDVSVPAGTFRALRIESEGPFQRIDMMRSGISKEVVWYVPEVKRYVKWSLESRVAYDTFQSWTLELVNYELK